MFVSQFLIADLNRLFSPDSLQLSVDSLNQLLSPDFLRTLGGFLAIPLIYYAIECFFGLRFFRIKCAIVGFTSGTSAGLLLGNAMQCSDGVRLALAIVIGLLFALAAFKVYKFGVFFTTALVGFSLGTALGGVVAGLIVAVVVGIIAVFLTRPSIIISSALSGGTGLASCIFAMLDYQNATALYIAGLALCIIGAVIQFKTSKA